MLTYRYATIDDANDLYEWRNDDETRKQSINMNVILWEDHIKWLNQVLEDPTHELFIIEENGSSVGTIRFDFYGNDMCEMSWTVAPFARGMGIGKQMVAMLIDQKKDKKLIARIKKGNIGSIKIARHVGFSMYDDSGDLTLWEIE